MTGSASSRRPSGDVRGAGADSDGAAGITGAGGGGSTVTIGVALALAEPHATEIQEARAGYGDPLARAIATHITLLPPTELPAELLGPVERQLAAAAAGHRPFRVLLHGSGSFRPVSPVVYVRLAAGCASAGSWRRRCAAGCWPGSWTFPPPHVTVAQALEPAVLDRAYRDFRDFRAEFTVSGFSLYRFGADRVWRPERQLSFGSGSRQPGGR
ncbi:2'-5' RNA ligase family protein [Streptacidiphilus sp. 4-A2]|nr:2'-5' RNA ligase family protein [Streptacidiphilus sp. 4-A2]